MAVEAVVAFFPDDPDHNDDKVLAFEIKKVVPGSQYHIWSIDINGVRLNVTYYETLSEALAVVACKMAAQPGITYRVEK